MSSPFEKIGNVLNPAAVIANATGNERLGSVLNDPYDLTGERAKRDRASVAAINSQTAQLGLDEARRTYEQNVADQKPYYDQGIQAMDTYNNGQWYQQPGAQYARDKRLGERDIRRQLAGRGLLDSSREGELIYDFNRNLANEEQQRQYGQYLDAIKIAQGAAGSTGAASQGYGSQAGSLYSNLGQQQASNIFNYGQNRANTYQGLSNSAQGMIDYFGGNK